MPDAPADFQHLATELQKWFQQWSYQLTNPNLPPPYAEVVIHLPALVQLVIRLLQAEDVTPEIKHPLSEAARYVLNPNDLLPEDLYGTVGLLEDTAIMGARLQETAAHSPALILQYWEQEGDILAILGHIMAHKEAILEYALARRKH